LWQDNSDRAKECISRQESYGVMHTAWKKKQNRKKKGREKKKTLVSKISGSLSQKAAISRRRSRKHGRYPCSLQSSQKRLFFSRLRET
jgi:hypothetical protein